VEEYAIELHAAIHPEVETQAWRRDRPDICSTTPLRLQVDDNGLTRVAEGPKANGDAFFQLLLSRLSAP
jgi:hypothetical protein